MRSECQKPHWGDQCCCNCRSQLIVKKHPWNSGEAKGSVLDTLAYACACPEFELENGKKTIIYSEEEHGMCEMWQPMEISPHPSVTQPEANLPISGLGGYDQVLRDEFEDGKK
jgi:hypothetical protein